jgi:hypothetical protein
LSTSYGSNITAGSGSNGNGRDVNVASRTSINDASGAFTTIDASPPSNETEEYAGQKSSFDNIAALEAEEEVNQRDDTNGSSLFPSGSSKEPVVTLYTVSPQAKRKVSKGKEKDDNSGDDSTSPQRKKARKSGEKNDSVSSKGKAKNSGVDNRSQKKKDIWLVSLGKCNGKCHKNQCGKDAVATFASSDGESWDACVACAEP